MFDPIHFNIQGKVGKEEVLTYYYDDEVVLVLDITSPCACSAVNNYIQEKKIEVKYTPVEIPKHLQLQNIFVYTTTKTITIKYQNKEGLEQIQELTFKAVVTR